MLGERVRGLRRARGLTQLELARRAGVTRQLLGSVETGRHLPRVDAAASIARALGVSVEQLLVTDRAPVVGVVGAPGEGQSVRIARVGDQLVGVPASPAGESWSPADAVVHGGEVAGFDADRSAALVAGCDPAIGLIARLVEADGGPAIIAAATSSAVASEALRDGRVHACVVHGALGSLPSAPTGVQRWRLARWQVGMAAAPDLPTGWVADALAGRVTVAQRELGAGSQAAFERAVAAAGHERVPTGPITAGHLEAAGWSQRAGYVAVTIEPAALALDLAFHPLEEHVSELWVASVHRDVPGVRRFLEELTGSRIQQRLVAIGGYDLTGIGTQVVA